MAEKREGNLRGKKRKRSEGSELEIGVEEFLSRNASLHNDVWRLYELMRDLDGQSSRMMEGLEEDFGQVKKLGGKEGSRKEPSKSFCNLTKRLTGRLNGDSAAVRNLGCTKIAIAQQGYDLLDRVIRELDHRIAMFDAAVDSNDSGPSYPKAQDSSVQTINPLARQQQLSGMISRSEPASTTNPLTRNGPCMQSPVARPTRGAPLMLGCHTLPLPAFSLLRFPGTSPLRQFPSAFSGDDFEPMYCWCQQVAYGDMISCDNPHCPYEWFHYDCVGMTKDSLPQQKWHCPYCRGVLAISASRK